MRPSLTSNGSFNAASGVVARTRAVEAKVSRPRDEDVTAKLAVPSYAHFSQMESSLS